MRINSVDRHLSRLFIVHIGFVIRHPLPFFLVPLFVSLLLSLGILQHSSNSFVKDELHLYTPTNARAHLELQHLERLFYINDSDPFYANRRYDTRRTGYVIVTRNTEKETSFSPDANNDGSGDDILDPITLQAAIRLWSVIQAFTIEDDESKTRVNYPSICVRFPIPDQVIAAVQEYVRKDVFALNEELVFLDRFRILT